MNRHVLTAADILSFSRILLCILTAITVKQIYSGNYHLPLLFGVLAIITDIIDGPIARQFNKINNYGKIIDPAADKISLAVIILATLQYTNFPVYIIGFLLLRDICIMYFSYILFKKKAVIIQSNIWGKLNTLVMAVSVVFYISRNAPQLTEYYRFFKLVRPLLNLTMLLTLTASSGSYLHLWLTERYNCCKIPSGFFLIISIFFSVLLHYFLISSKILSSII